MDNGHAAQGGAAFAHHRNFKFPGDPNAVAPVLDAVLTFINETHCIPGLEDEVALALQEALANAVVHGCKNNPALTVQLDVHCDRTAGLEVVIKDPGPGFDVQTVASPLTEEGLVRDHGRGLHMIRGLMDDVTFEDHGTVIRLRKLPTQAS